MRHTFCILHVTNWHCSAKDGQGVYSFRSASGIVRWRTCFPLPQALRRLRAPHTYLKLNIAISRSCNCDSQIPRLLQSAARGKCSVLPSQSRRHCLFIVVSYCIMRLRPLITNVFKLVIRSTQTFNYPSVRLCIRSQGGRRAHGESQRI